ncbi:uncharacterized protein F5147DRAFT_778294 [Suillus discolor]|uniref:Uncharacterized protein n=1 Tax=Suillus discolor TaxID=1912936 RepID=A0A9P7EXC2_9AGAM|nr:uncharacterized protein F5147DRAFT_778294 [Suillus discolor]KAG2096501.1 hypothetical protein F5147DRAFT_778294 [Suillus discolor]
MPNAEFSNTAMGDAAERLMKIVQKAAKLRDGHPDHLKLAVEIGDLMSPVFKTHGMSVTTIPPILLLAAMEMLEHLDAVQQSFASAPVWARIRTDDPQIQQHPLKEKAHSITVAKPTTAANTSAAISGAPVPAKVKPKPKPKPMPKTKVVHESKESKGNDPGPTRGNSPPAYTSSQKGKGKAVVPPGNEEEAVEVNRGRLTQVQKRRKGSNTSLPPIPGGAPQHHPADSTAMQTKTSKRPKVTRESVSPKHNALKEDITMDTDCPELVPPCTSFVVKDMAPQAPNFELVAVAPNKNLNVLMPKPTSMAEDMLVSDDDTAAATATTLPSPATSVPPITTLSPEGEAPPPLSQLVSSIQHPQMDMDNSHDGLTKVLEGMTLEVMQDLANLSARNVTLQEIADTLRTNIAQLTAENTAATEQLNALQDRITAQDAALLELQGLRAEVTELHSQVKTLQEESATRDQHLQRAQHQLGQQERTTAVLQDAYNAICQCLTGPPNSSSPFTNSLYLANPMYGSSQSMVPVSMGQMQAMEGLYFNLPSSVGNISSGSMLGGPSAGPSVSTIASSTRTHGDTKGGAPSGVGNEPGNR